MVKKIWVYVFMVLLALPVLTQAAPLQPFIDKYIPNNSIIGQAGFDKYFFHVYDITLFAPDKKYDADQPFALSISYSMSLKGKEIAKRSIEEMQKQGYQDKTKLAEWQKFMSDIFPDVKKGINLTGIYTAKKQTIFFKDGIEIGRTSDKEFGQKFFDIWLSDKTSEPELRKKLLGI